MSSQPPHSAHEPNCPPPTTATMMPATSATGSARTCVASTDPTSTASTSSTSNVVDLLLVNDHAYLHILENIFFRLDPVSLLSVTRCCKKWNSFFQAHIWKPLNFDTKGENGETRRMERIIKVGTVADLSHHEWPHCISSNKDLVAVVPWTNNLLQIEIYNRRTLKLRVKLASTSPNRMMRMRLSISEEYLILDGLKWLDIFHLSDFRKISANQLLPRKIDRLDFAKLSDRGQLLLPMFSEELECYMILGDELSFQWKVKMNSFSAMDSWSDLLVLCEFRVIEIQLTLYSAKSGAQLCKMSLPSPNRCYVERLSGHKSTVAVLTSAGNGQSGWNGLTTSVLVWDLELCVLLRCVEVDCSDMGLLTCGYLGDEMRMWCDKSSGTLVMMAGGRAWSKILIWNLTSLTGTASATETAGAKIRPDHIIATGCYATPEAVVAAAGRLIYPTTNGDGMVVILDCCAWGRVKRRMKTRK